MTYRVIQWSLGNVGRLALRAIVEHPDLELVGCWVHSAEKAGRDVGELCGIGPVGIAATNDAEALLASNADCVSYMSTGDLRPGEAVDDMCRMLEVGKNVVSTSVVSLIYPPSAPKGFRDKLGAACDAGKASCFTSGIDPGFANDLVPLVLSGFCSRVDSVRVMEILNYDTYDQPEVLFDTMGFGKPLDHMPLLLLPGALSFAWGGAVHAMAAGLGVELDEVRETHEKWAATETFSVPSGTVERGTMAGLRFEVHGVVGGEPRIVVEHVTRMHDDAAPEWPHPAGKGSYRVVLEGDPSIQAELEFVGADGDHNTGGLLMTAMRVLNAIPAVCEAEPGLLSVLDLPLVTGKGLMR
jgi:2,4-diaminopentanoate dehydrogenase